MSLWMVWAAEVRGVKEAKEQATSKEFCARQEHAIRQREARGRDSVRGLLRASETRMMRLQGMHYEGTLEHRLPTSMKVTLRTAAERGQGEGQHMLGNLTCVPSASERSCTRARCSTYTGSGKQAIERALESQ